MLNMRKNINERPDVGAKRKNIHMLHIHIDYYYELVGCL